MYITSPENYAFQKANSRVPAGHWPDEEFWGQHTSFYYPLLVCPPCGFRAYEGYVRAHRHLAQHFPSLIGEREIIPPQPEEREKEERERWERLFGEEAKKIEEEPDRRKEEEMEEEREEKEKEIKEMEEEMEEEAEEEEENSEEEKDDEEDSKEEERKAIEKKLKKKGSVKINFTEDAQKLIEKIKKEEEEKKKKEPNSLIKKILENKKKENEEAEKKKNQKNQGNGIDWGARLCPPEEDEKEKVEFYSKVPGVALNHIRTAACYALQAEYATPTPEPWRKKNFIQTRRRREERKRRREERREKRREERLEKRKKKTRKGKEKKEKRRKKKDDDDDDDDSWGLLIKNLKKRI